MSHAAVFAGCLVLSGCHSAFVAATVTNHSGAAIRMVEMDYPTASFGTSTLADGSTFNYKFKILGSGPTNLSWTDANEKEHTSSGPPLHQGQEGTLAITIGPNGLAGWQPALK